MLPILHVCDSLYTAPTSESHLDCIASIVAIWSFPVSNLKENMHKHIQAKSHWKMICSSLYQTYCSGQVLIFIRIATNVPPHQECPEQTINPTYQQAHCGLEKKVQAHSGDHFDWIPRRKFEHLPVTASAGPKKKSEHLPETTSVQVIHPNAELGWRHFAGRRPHSSDTKAFHYTLAPTSIAMALREDLCLHARYSSMTGFSDSRSQLRCQIIPMF